MERFAPALRRVARELDVPRPIRSALLLEMAADLEAVFEHHRSRGLSDADAASRAEETVLGSSEVIRRLSRLHRNPWRGWPEAVGARLGGAPALALMAAGVLPVVALAGAVAAWSLSGGMSPLAWVVVGVGALMSGVAGREAARLARGRPIRSGRLPALLVLSALAAALGVLALALAVHSVGLEVAGSAGAGQAVLAARVARDGATLLLGLLLGITGIVAWFVLLSREARRASRELDALLMGGAPDTPAPGREPGSGSIIPLVRRRQG